MRIQSECKPVMEFLLSLRLFRNRTHQKRFDLNHKWKEGAGTSFSKDQLGT